jgi:hypothetical protein
MKKLLLIIGVLAPTLCFAQQFSIPWYSITGGGGTSASGPFTLTGSIGQPAIGLSMSGGNFSLTGGFWSIIAAVQTAGAPTLTITVTGPGTAVISWPASSSGYVLQQNSALGTSDWANVTTTVTVVGGQNEVTVSTQPGNNFFRLVLP